VFTGAIVGTDLVSGDAPAVTAAGGVDLTVLGGDVETAAVLTSIVGVPRLFEPEEHPPVAIMSSATNSQRRLVHVLRTPIRADRSHTSSSSLARLRGAHRNSEAVHPGLTSTTPVRNPHKGCC
jgi:hypothetical protein